MWYLDLNLQELFHVKKRLYFKGLHTLNIANLVKQGVLAGKIDTAGGRESVNVTHKSPQNIVKVTAAASPTSAVWKVIG